MSKCDCGSSQMQISRGIDMLKGYVLLECDSCGARYVAGGIVPAGQKMLFTEWLDIKGIPYKKD